METQTNHGSKLNIGFFFLSLGVLISLITSVVSFLNLAFSTLDKRFPDVLNATYGYGYNTYDYESIRTSLATLIIFFPVFLLISYFWNKFAKHKMHHVDELVKKWMIYIILFLSSLVVVIDLVTLVRYFVSGEITNRFIYKVLITLVIALFVGVYYVFELTNRKKVYGLPVGISSAVKSSVLVLLLVIFSFYIMGSPASQRQLRLDERRISDLQSIQSAVINYWQQKEKLPITLTELSNPLSGFTLPPDPEFQKGFVYEYKVKEGLTFELCATFAKPIPKGWRENTNYYAEPYLGEKYIAVSYPGYPVSGTNESWDHEAGRTCFERTIDKDIYPPYPKADIVR
ncbi:MAG: DUF5671 domain-containing protein [Candidatus Paceibacterota bacterium]